MVAELSLPIIVGAALIDGINPCAFGVLIFMLAYLAKSDGKKMMRNGIIYIVAVFLTYLAAGLLLLPVIRSLGKFSVISYFVLALVILLAGLLEVKDFFFYGRWFSLSIAPDEAKRVKMYVKKVGNKWYTAFGLGVFVALVELPCTGAVYLAVLALMSMSGLSLTNWAYLVVYNLIFVLPLFVILWAVCKGLNTDKVKKWQEHNKKYMRLIMGIVLIGLAVWMLVTTIRIG